MSLLRQEISKRMKGECRINVQAGAIIRMDGDRMESCAECSAYCMEGQRRSGYAGESLKIETISLGEGNVKLAWPCPGCGRETVEDSTAVSAPSHAKEIEKDPLCGKCRLAQSEAHK